MEWMINKIGFGAFGPSTEKLPAACGRCKFTECTEMTRGDRVKAYTKVQPFIDTNLEGTKRMFPNGISADPQIGADEIVRIVDLAKGALPAARSPTAWTTERKS